MQRAPFWTLLGAATVAAGCTLGALVGPPTVYETAQVQTLPKGGVNVGDGSVAKCDTDASCAQYAWDHGWAFDEMTPKSMVGDRSRPYGWANTDGCWVEKAHSVQTAEVICGEKGDRPRTDTADIGDVFATNDDPCGYVASWAWAQGWDIQPAGCN